MNIYLQIYHIPNSNLQSNIYVSLTFNRPASIQFNKMHSSTHFSKNLKKSLKTGTLIHPVNASEFYVKHDKSTIGSGPSFSQFKNSIIIKTNIYVDLFRICTMHIYLHIHSSKSYGKIAKNACKKFCIYGMFRSLNIFGPFCRCL